MTTDPLEPYRNVPRPATPGPWKAHHGWFDGHAIYIANGDHPSDADYRDVAQVAARRPDDARAIAAFPEILEKFDRLVRAVEYARKAVYASHGEPRGIDSILRGGA